MARPKNPWVVGFGIATVLSLLSVAAIPVYQDTGRERELRTVLACASNEDAWVAAMVLCIPLFPALVSGLVLLLAPRPPILGRVALALLTIAYALPTLGGILVIAMEGMLISFMSSGSLRADNLLVDAAAWIVGLFWIAVGLVAAVLVFVRWDPRAAPPAKDEGRAQGSDAT